MSLAGGDEIRLDAKMHLDSAAAKPAAAARSQHRWLLHLGHAKRPGPERATGRLAARRDRELDVVQAGETEVEV